MATYKLLTEPLTKDELFEALRDTRIITGVVEVDGGVFLDAATDGPGASVGNPNVESVHRLLSECLTGTPLLEHVFYKVLSSEGSTFLHIEVTGDATAVVVELGRSKPTVVPDDVPLVRYNRPDFIGGEGEKDS